MTRATLSEVRTAVASVEPYQRYAGVSVGEAVDVICDWQGIADDRDRRIIRNAAIRRQQEQLLEARRAAG